MTTTDLRDTRVSCVGLVAGRASQHIQAQGQGRFQNLPGTLEGLERGGALCMLVQQGRRCRQGHGLCMTEQGNQTQQQHKSFMDQRDSIEGGGQLCVKSPSAANDNECSVVVTCDPIQMPVHGVQTARLPVTVCGNQSNPLDVRVVVRTTVAMIALWFLNSHQFGCQFCYNPLAHALTSAHNNWIERHCVRMHRPVLARSRCNIPGPSSAAMCGRPTTVP